jgi:hypothetical protein
MTYHRFEFGDEEAHYWTHVQPGDLVSSQGSSAYKACEFATRNGETKVFNLVNGLLLVLSRQIGVPGEDHSWNDSVHTFVVWSRHGALVLMQNRRRG